MGTAHDPMVQQADKGHRRLAASGWLIIGTPASTPDAPKLER
ncbi:hypothetical protein I545_2314 [Mycobacterium kansasii 662]|uniref:Uncharacterized protein n=2 Tax=Mycobacterium kansasii TaxID=1768 RepID=A0A1V3XHZ7_MYCKA|nr:hypothetical protein I547_4187 [Mycobacterium kansasii 824]EUA19997.1 hypothetical protein I545_2314 [Mycobacterium kansasii 662]KEP40252.1 hypothetical protein MKSMC1_45960 [Mycobacterium kansasii]OOK78819.1 hypothetical protein BZL30_1858 [Mycobacterium kansasii]OOK80129.1 hypothetical protein BZL29_1909 [Mycobacterium kansasii]